MKLSSAFPSIACLVALLSGCVPEGQSPDCGAGGRGHLEEVGCMTPVGGSCLTEEQFKQGRPGEREDERGRTVTLEEDWAQYQALRPHCF